MTLYKIFSFYSLIIGLFILSCASLNSNSGTNINLEKALSIKPGVSTKVDIENTFGKPQKISQLNEIPELNDEGEIWAYHEEPYSNSSRLSFYFKKGALVTSSVGWDVRDQESEQNLEAAKKIILQKFPNTHFKERDEGWASSHSYSDRRFIEDAGLGVAISYRIKRNEVSGISWSDPKIYSEIIQKQQRRLACLEHGCSSDKK